MKKTNTQINQKRPFSRSISLLLSLVGVFTILAGMLAYMAFTGVRKLISTWEMTSLPGVTIFQGSTPTPGLPGQDQPTTLPPPVTGPLPIPWDGASRVNMLVMGLDYRDWEAGQGAPRTDTMILLSIDPVTKTAAMLSIPRDLWVTIPTFSEPDRINTAYRAGELYKYPGGGPGLAMKTVEGLLGLKIDYFAQIDFYAFEKFIDEIGGIEIDIPSKVKISPIGGHIITIKKGLQTLNGSLALAYARARYTEGGDFDRANRQQLVIMAIRKRLMEPKGFPNLVEHATQIYTDLSAGIHTNMTLDLAIKVAWLAYSVPEKDFLQGVIGPEQTAFAKSPTGDDVLKPLPVKIRLLRDEIFSSSGLLGPAAVVGFGNFTNTLDLVKAENARIFIYNGAATPGLATRTMDYLKNLGINILGTGDAQQVTTYTTIIDSTGNPQTIKYLVDLMKISSQKILFRYDPASQTDITVILGYDWVNNNPMPGG